MAQPDEDRAPSRPDERDPEAPEYDAVEDIMVAGDEDDPVSAGFEVDEADALEQARVVRVEEDDYR
jgi:hypothetical protein